MLLDKYDDEADNGNENYTDYNPHDNSYDEDLREMTNEEIDRYLFGENVDDIRCQNAMEMLVLFFLIGVFACVFLHYSSLIVLNF